MSANQLDEWQDGRRDSVLMNANPCRVKEVYELSISFVVLGINLTNLEYI